MTRIGLAQWHAVCGEPRRNLADALALIDSAAASGSDWIVLPELWPAGYDPGTLSADVAASAEPLDGPRGTALSSAARAHGVWLFAGSVPERDGDRIFNTSIVYGPDGVLRAAHRKTHLYWPLGEDEVFAAGDGPTVFELEGLGTVGLSTCFDGDHPDFARALNGAGARIVVAPCAYEAGAESWWDILYPANALANGQWWILVNQSGGELFGRSRVIAPDGTVVAEAARSAGEDATQVLVVDVDLAAGIEAADRDAVALWAGRPAPS